MQLINYTLPEWLFLDGHTHQGNTLQGRTVFQHIRSYTIIEAMCLDDISEYDYKVPTHKFQYTNSLGVIENHMLAIHFTLSDDLPIDILTQAQAWYCDYMTWEDENILGDEISIHN